ncbi:ATP-binding protein [Frankia sp. CiP3]|uniref:ATP-binding protein n=1 Tax=Frankia sp. CiP3 TaxID=2880971 RepID=UPI001EF45DEC|nr:ATP-binding protein [Frankia sp. CiP3]
MVTVRVAVERFPAGPASVPAARKAAVRVLRGWAVDDATVETAELIVSELVTNAEKASSADDVIAVRLTAADGRLTLEVWDSSDSSPVQRGQDIDAESGRGLFLVEALSMRRGWYWPRSGGKVVWAQLRAEIQPAQPLKSVGTIPGPAEALDRRTAGRVPDAPFSIAFVDHPALLQRVVDGLRALDGWHRPARRLIPSGEARSGAGETASRRSMAGRARASPPA